MQTDRHRRTRGRPSAAVAARARTVDGRRARSRPRGREAARGAQHRRGATHGSGTVVRPFRWMPLHLRSLLFLLAVQADRRSAISGRRAGCSKGRSSGSRPSGRRKKNFERIERVLDSRDPLPSDYAASQASIANFISRSRERSQNAVLDRSAGAAARRPCRRHRPSFHRGALSPTHLGGARGDPTRRFARRMSPALNEAMREHFTVGPDRG